MKKIYTIHEMQASDIGKICATFCFPWTSPEKTQEKWNHCFEEHQQRIRTVYLLKIDEQIIGYANLLYISKYLRFRELNTPEINDVWIAKELRGLGNGTRLIRHLENVARKEGFKQIGLGVGLYKDYGSAQKLYFQLGYTPDGHGITYRYQPIVPGATHPIDDDLILWLVKPLC